MDSVIPTQVWVILTYRVGVIITTGNIGIYRPRVFIVVSGSNQ